MPSVAADATAADDAADAAPDTATRDAASSGAEVASPSSSATAVASTGHAAEASSAHAAARDEHGPKQSPLQTRANAADTEPSITPSVAADATAADDAADAAPSASAAADATRDAASSAATSASVSTSVFDTAAAASSTLLDAEASSAHPAATGKHGPRQTPPRTRADDADETSILSSVDSADKLVLLADDGVSCNVAADAATAAANYDDGNSETTFAAAPALGGRVESDIAAGVSSENSVDNKQHCHPTHLGGSSDNNNNNNRSTANTRSDGDAAEKTPATGASRATAATNDGAPTPVLPADLYRNNWSVKKHRKYSSAGRIDRSNGDTANVGQSGSDEGVNTSKNSTGADSADEGHGDDNNDGENTGSGSSTGKNDPPVFPREIKRHVGPSLKAGQKLQGSLLSPERTSMIYASAVDASVVFETLVGAVPRGAAGPSPRVSTTLIAGDPKKIARVHRLRAELLEEEDTRIAERGRMGAVMGWMPFGKDGWRQRRARENAKAHLGEVTMTITSRGILETSMDGTVIVRKSGRSWFGFARKDPTYELRVTEEGFEVSRQGTRKWGVKAEDIFD
ncbi:unnamed protein product [Pylaiella littoralis]